MKTRFTKWLAALALLPVLAFAQEEPDVEQGIDDPMDVEIPMSKVPPRILEAAKAARPMAALVQVRRTLEEDDETYYVFDASQFNKYYVIVVRADGVVVEVDEESEPPELH